MTPGKKPGSPKTGGRQKGTPNRLSMRTREELWAYCQAKGVNPFTHAVDVLAGDIDGVTLDHQLECAKDLRAYLLPKLKQIEAEVGPETTKVIRFLYGKRD